MSNTKIFIVMTGIITAIILLLSLIKGPNASETFTKSIKEHIKIQEQKRREKCNCN